MLSKVSKPNNATRQQLLNAPDAIDRVRASAVSAVSMTWQVARLTRVIVLLSISSLISLILLAVATSFVTRTHYSVIASTDRGLIVPVAALDKPLLSDSRLIGFVDECARKAFSHDFVSWRTSVNEAKVCFTPEGEKSYEEAIMPWVEDIRQREMIMSIAIPGMPVIAKSGMDGGRRAWLVEAPIQLFRRGTRTYDQPRDFMLQVVVHRVALEDSARGVAISSIRLRPATSQNN